MMLFDPIDASEFDAAPQLYEAEFIDLLSKIVCCYDRFISKDEKVANNEDQIRDHLYVNYFRNDDIRNEFSLKFQFECEPKEFGLISGYVDLKITNINTFEKQDAYYIIECKRLDAKGRRTKSGLNGKYIKDGILRFVDGKYSVYHRINGMIGFVVEPLDIAANAEDLNSLLQNDFPEANTIKNLTLTRDISKCTYQYQSRHMDHLGNDFTLYHMMLDFSSSIVA